MAISRERLLKIPEVINEINRHLWFESEKAGHDVGREYAENDWMEKYSKDWIRHNLPNEAKKNGKSSEKKTVEIKKKADAPKSKKRRAKSYNG